MLKRIIRALAGFAIIAVGLFIARALIGMKEERPMFSPPRAVKLVRTMPVSLAEEAPLTYIKGRAVSLDRMEVYAEVNGLVLPSAQPFRTGKRYEKGDVMLRLDAGELEMTLVAQRSALLQVLTGVLPDLKIDHPNAYEKWRNYTATLDVTKLVQPLPEFDGDQEKFLLSNRGVLNQYYTIRSAEERLAKFVLTAPFTGEVTSSNINPGALVRSGQRIGEFVSIAGFEIESALPREALAHVLVGDSVSLRAEATGEEMAGIVNRVLRTIDPSTQTAKVFIKTDHVALRDGVYLSGVIRSRKLSGVMRVPRELLVNDRFVFVVEGDSVLTLLPVEVLARSERDALISGLLSGSMLLAEPVANAYEGMAVSVATE